MSNHFPEPRKVRQLPNIFQVAFSLAGEQRDLVRSIAEEVEKKLGSPNVFFDEWFEAYIAGDDADLKLQEIYGTKCVLAVVCVSGRYGNKPWTLAEHAAIRARQMKSRTSADKRDQLGVLPIRVGDGDVEGILFNAIVPDIREKTVSEAAELIVERLGLLSPIPDNNTRPDLDWPEQLPSLRWPMANHTEVRVAFERLLTRKSPWRVLLVRGASEVGKSHVTRQMLGNALRVPDLACGRFDFKGSTDLDAELRSFIQHFDVALPAPGQRLNERLGCVFDALKRRAHAALYIFDTYEAAGEAQDWMEKQLLPSLIRATWLRVIIAGQRVPDRTDAIWETDAHPVITLNPPPPADWLEYAKQYHPDLTLEYVETTCKLASNKATVLQQLLGPGT
jgi:hypothetical protein